MTKTRKVPFGKMRQLLADLGYREKTVENAIAFFRTQEDMLIFRRYKAKEAMRPGDVESTRLFLNSHGILAEADFDAFFERPATSA